MTLLETRRTASLEEYAAHGIVEAPAESGVYALFDNEFVVYVGRSSNMRKRIGQHLAEGVKHFSEYRCYPLNESIQVLETFLIRRIGPRYNSGCWEGDEITARQLDLLVREWAARRGPPKAENEEEAWKEAFDRAILETGTIPPKAPEGRIGRRVWHEYATRLIKEQVDASAKT